MEESRGINTSGHDWWKNRAGARSGSWNYAENAWGDAGAYPGKERTALEQLFLFSVFSDSLRSFSYY